MDAASRGLKTALVELDDFASGTSSRSTKLIHGGVRYLQKAIMGLDLEQYNMVREALHERGDTLGHTGTHWDTLGHTGTHWDTLGHTGTHWDTLGHTGTHWD